MINKQELGPRPAGVSCVVVVHEDSGTRQMAVRFCDELVLRFWTKRSFSFSWWSFASLTEANAGRVAAERAAEADLIVFATRQGMDLPLEIKCWVADWERKRAQREGCLVVLTDSPQTERTAEPHFYFRGLAHRSGLDYLTQMPSDLSQSIPESVESCHARAQRVTSVLDDILSRTPWAGPLNR